MVLPHPLADDEHAPGSDAYNRPSKHEPGLWCPWTATLGGLALAFNGIEKAYNASEWLDYLIRTFLRPGADASRVEDPSFAQFTLPARGRAPPVTRWRARLARRSSTTCLTIRMSRLRFYGQISSHCGPDRSSSPATSRFWT